MVNPIERWLITATALVTTSLSAQISISNNAREFSVFSQVPPTQAVQGVLGGKLPSPTDLFANFGISFVGVNSGASYELTQNGNSWTISFLLQTLAFTQLSQPITATARQSVEMDFTITAPEPQPFEIAFQSTSQGSVPFTGTVDLDGQLLHQVGGTTAPMQGIADPNGVVITVDLGSDHTAPLSFGGTLTLDLTITPNEITATAQPIGAGCAGSNGIPSLAALTLPWIGETYTQQVTNLPPGATLGLEFGFSDQLWQGLVLPFDLSIIGMMGCQQLIGPTWVTPMIADGTGAATHSIALANNASLVDLELFSQAFVIDPGANALGGTVSNALGAVLGAR